jgi:hypothetical protein
LGESSKRRNDLLEILCIPMFAVGRPGLHGEVTGVVNLVANRGERREETRLSQRSRGLLLPR